MPKSLNYANLRILSTNPFYKRASDNEGYHLNPIPLNVLLNNRTDEGVQENGRFFSKEQGFQKGEILFQETSK
ncbi:hypothetical protein TNCT_113781 [Trichonephila clavata]|uniref:Uncharacterized protein n=1 Tax=Trichonephila clavata TaxID=2740835 RepID=A0A8X6GLI1_TRICU|nr:hypothetical protein TNCT_113781 [Trichonephila clavata]